MLTYVQTPLKLETKVCWVILNLNGTMFTDRLFASLADANSFLQVQELTSLKELAKQARIFPADRIVMLHSASNYYLPDLGEDDEI